MPDIKIEIDQAKLEELRHALADIKNGVPKAMSRAINTTVTGVKTDMVFIAREQYNFKAAALRDRIRVYKASPQKLSAKVASTGKPIHLTDITGTTWRGPQAAGTTVNVKKATGRKMIKSAWIGTGKHSGKEIVMTRTDEKGLRRRTTPEGRYPVKALYAPHPEIIYNYEPVWKSIRYLADITLEKRLNHEMDALMKGYTS